MRSRSWILPLGMWLLAGLGLAACQRDTATSTPADAATGAATRPAQAVRLLTAHLRRDDLAAFARDAVPPALHARLDAAWRAGRTRWPLDELPLGGRIPSMLGALAEPDAERHWRTVFDRQFAHAGAELKSTAATLGLFGAQYLRNEGDFSDDERAHFAQLVAATGRWAQSAPLSDPARAHAAIPRLAAAARRTGLRTEADFARMGMDDSLRRLSGFSATLKQALTGYGLDVDADLGALDASLQSQTGDRARVRMRYRFAGSAIDALVDVERIDGRWYVSDFLRHADAAADAKEAPAKTPTPAITLPTPTPAPPPAAQPGAARSA